jgi:ribosome-associated toxin RatA of RatAB toxin-antitoxin module
VNRLYVSDAVEVSTVVYISPEEAYEFIVDFPRYARYSKYLNKVTQDGDGHPGTEYDLHFEWWKLSYTARSRVTTPPAQLDWQIIKDLDAAGHWHIEPLPDHEIPEDKDHAVRIRLDIDFRPESADTDAIELPRFVSLSWVVQKVRPLIQEEAERVVSRIVTDLEGESREVDLQIHRTPTQM